MSFGNGTPPMAILEPIIKAQIEKAPFFNLGGFIVGFGIDTTLLGMMLVMLVDWWKYAPKESWTIRIVLFYSVFAAVVATAYNVHIMLYHFMQNFGKYAPFLLGQRTGGWAIIGSVSVPQIQAFYAARAFRLNNNNWFMLVAISLGILCQFGASVACAALHYSTPAIERKDVVSKPIYVWVSSTLFTDGLITACIIHGLKKNKTAYSETTRLINKLVTITAEASLPATVVSIGFLVTFCRSGNTDMFVLFWEMFHPKMYILPLIAVLNSRTKLQQTGSAFTHGSSTGQHSQQTFVLDSLHSGPSSAKLDGIHIDTTTERQEHPVAPYSLGLNRQRKDDESSIGALTDERHGGSMPSDSTTALATPFATFRSGAAR